jgi:hypothetical protein
MAKRGRPPGRHSDPNYTLVAAYVRRSVYEAVKKKLAVDNGDFSQLVEKLFADWLLGNAAKQPTSRGQGKAAGR